MDSTGDNQIGRANRRRTSPHNVERLFRSNLYAQPCSPAAAAHFWCSSQSGMKLISVFVGLLLVAGCSRATESSRSQTQAKASDTAASAQVDRCPAGHTTIKLVPIVYGRIALTPERREQERNLEVAYGGCEVGSKGKFRIVCLTCGAHTYEGKFPWYDKDTKVIPNTNTTK